ncbi:MAG: hypothetical protein M0D55_17045 [Elusimicrobiota bacterium]|nr:MAG: hypothetical protein M0D55_17045 [Elusimicrobiota bacterium]
MSISREIWRRASPSNRRRFAAARRFAPLALGAGLFGAFLVTVPWGDALANMENRRAERAQLAPLLAEARTESLTFPQVVVSNPAHLNKVVYWDVTVQSSTASYADGRQSWPIVWTNPGRVSSELSWHQTAVLARVASVRDDVVWLEYLGRP